MFAALLIVCHWSCPESCESPPYIAEVEYLIKDQLPHPQNLTLTISGENVQLTPDQSSGATSSGIVDGILRLNCLISATMSTKASFSAVLYYIWTAALYWIWTLSAVMLFCLMSKCWGVSERADHWTLFQEKTWSINWTLTHCYNQMTYGSIVLLKLPITTVLVFKCNSQMADLYCFDASSAIIQWGCQLKLESFVDKSIFGLLNESYTAYPMIVEE